MSTTKAIIKYRGQDVADILFRNTFPRVKDDIAFTRHLIKYFLYRKRCYSSKSIERRFSAISSGFDHASVLHSVGVVEFQTDVFGKMVSDIEQLLQN